MCSCWRRSVLYCCAPSTSLRYTLSSRLSLHEGFVEAVWSLRNNSFVFFLFYEKASRDYGSSSRCGELSLLTAPPTPFSFPSHTKRITLFR